VFRGPNLPKTRYKLIVGATTMDIRDITPTDAPTRTLVPIRMLLLHLPPTSGAISVPIAAKQNYARERVNHVATEEAQEAPDVVIGMFFINNTSAIVLFDSGASQSFISPAYVEKHNLPMPC
jgi:hypothetical protein